MPQESWNWKALDPALKKSNGSRAENATSGEESLARLFSTTGEGELGARARNAAGRTARSLWLQEPRPAATSHVASMLLRGAIRVAILSLVAWGLLFNFSEVRGSSMKPGIHDRDRILVDNFSYMVGDVHHGDIIVLRYPLDPSLDYIKRVVGLPGDEVRIDGGQLWINGVLVDEPYVAPECIDPFTRLVTRVKEKHYFVLGDNRLRSSDSREFGQVPHSNVRGKVQLRLWPPGRVGWID